MYVPGQLAQKMVVRILITLFTCLRISFVNYFAIPMLVVLHNYCNTHFQGLTPRPKMLHVATHRCLGFNPRSLVHRQGSYLGLLPPTVLPLATMWKKLLLYFKNFIYIYIIEIFWVHCIPDSNSLQWGMAIGNAMKQKGSKGRDQIRWKNSSTTDGM